MSKPAAAAMATRGNATRELVQEDIADGKITRKFAEQHGLDIDEPGIVTVAV